MPPVGMNGNRQVGMLDPLMMLHSIGRKQLFVSHDCELHKQPADLTDRALKKRQQQQARKRTPIN